MLHMYELAQHWQNLISILAFHLDFVRMGTCRKKSKQVFVKDKGSGMWPLTI